MPSNNKFTKLKLQKTENNPSDTTEYERIGGPHQQGDCLPYATTIKQTTWSLLLFREGLVEDGNFLIDLLHHLQKAEDGNFLIDLLHHLQKTVTELLE
jgi:hypothetical protein